MNTQRLVLAAFLCLQLYTVGAVPPQPAAQTTKFNGQILHILTWSDYLDPTLIADFETSYQVKLKFTYFETDEHRDHILAETGTQGYDLAIIDSVKLPMYRKQGWIGPIDRSLIPNLKHMDPTCQSEKTDQENYAVAYFWGTLGIAYRADLVDKPITRWMQLYQPEEQLKGKIVMIDDSREVMSMAAMALGHSIDSTNPKDWEAAAELVLRQKPYVHSYGYIAIDENSGLISGDILAAQIYNGEALVLQELNPDIVYSHPAEGSSYWVDSWAVFHNAPHAELAHAFLNFINEPANAAANAQSVYFATCNKTAESLLPTEFLQDPIIYPPPEVLQRMRPFTRLPPRVISKINTLYSQITKGL